VEGLARWLEERRFNAAGAARRSQRDVPEWLMTRVVPG
jgi:hypothetical protein